MKVWQYWGLIGFICWAVGMLTEGIVSILCIVLAVYWWVISFIAQKNRD